ncbi:MAG: oxidoreductase, partial [Candidatus Baldrarchaeia archaeon]
MPTKNATVVFKEPKKVVLEDEPIPEPKPGQFLIKTLKTLISIGTELAILSGEARPDSVWGKLSKFPVHPGYSNVGKVVK